MLRFFDSRCKVGITWDLSPRTTDIHPNALPTKSSSLIIKAHKFPFIFLFS